MPVSLSRVHRKLLENTTAAARVLAESACSAALENLAVHEKDYRGHMTVEQRLLRNRLRARGRALGDKRDERSGLQGMYHLKELAAYEHWHRLLFTRFLTENHLLITDEPIGSVPITLEECEELAPEMGARDGFDLACRFASRTLPGVFRRDDPVLDLPVALNDQVELRKLLAKLPPDCFTADDSLGWTYQFWQAQRKDEVNASGKKIGADELSPVTQLFTEDYMVEFLLHNTLGAWWAGKLGPINADSEAEARARAGLPVHDGVPGIAWTYLRFIQKETDRTWVPAAGTFDGWPKTANLIRLLDPCMGSGHFLVFALPLLVRLRMEEGQLDPRAAVVAVLKDNIHGLELDERCTQIAAFNVALTGWKLAGYQVLPTLHLACSGLAPVATEAEWQSLAGDNDRLRRGMMRLYQLFKDAPVLGSLINPPSQEGNLIEGEFRELAPVLTSKLAALENRGETLGGDGIELTVIAQGIAKAAELLSDHFDLVITNVPYLGRVKQNSVLAAYCARKHPMAKTDLAACFIERCMDFCRIGGTSTLVTPQNWLFQSSYKDFRCELLNKHEWEWVVRLGEHGFDSDSAAGALVVLFALTRRLTSSESYWVGLEAGEEESPQEKASAIRTRSVQVLEQAAQLRNPDSRITFSFEEKAGTLSDLCASILGLGTGDYPHYGRCFWEMPHPYHGWAFQQGTVADQCLWGGREHLVAWDFATNRVGGMTTAERIQIHNQDQSGQQAWGHRGVAVGLMRDLKVTLYSGERHEKMLAVLIPKSEDLLPALWAFCTTRIFHDSVRRLDKNKVVANGTLVKVPFDPEYWKQKAREKYPNGLPPPQSNDPVQWLFDGHPKHSAQPLHAAMARLLGYQWPRQTGTSFPDCPALGLDGLEAFADSNGIVCLPPVSREQPAANRLRQLLTAALGTFDERTLTTASGLKGSKSKTLEDWLRDDFFEQHAKLFLDRPFIWHLWDGRPDGFHALVNFHKLDHATLQKLTFSYLGNWIQQQAEDAKADKPGAAARLGAALALQKKLASILEGEAPFDIFVRWKPLKEQAQGWHPDLNDGIRQNIRPFLLAGDVGKRGAGLFRSVPLKLKDSDRGSEPHRPNADYPWFWCEEEPGTDPAGGDEFVGTRWNNVHLSLDKKRRSKP